jgi:hypothetical protein
VLRDSPVVLTKLLHTIITRSQGQLKRPWGPQVRSDVCCPFRFSLLYTGLKPFRVVTYAGRGSALQTHCQATQRSICEREDNGHEAGQKSHHGDGNTRREGGPALGPAFCKKRAGSTGSCNLGARWWITLSKNLETVPKAEMGRET